MKTYEGNIEITKENAKKWAEKLRLVTHITGYVRAEQGASITLPEGAKTPNQELRKVLDKELKDEFLKEGYLLVDGLLSIFVSKRKQGEVTVYKTKSIGLGAPGYVVQSGEKYSHGETVKKAIADLRYKIGSRDTTKYKALGLDTVKPTEQMIEAFRVITGACETGTRQWCEGKTFPARMSVKVAIRATKGAYGGESFAAFFKGAK